jgi:hypothetical protein
MLRVGTIGNLIPIAALCIVVFIFMMAIRPAPARNDRIFSTLPLVEYDKPYTGELWITRFHSEQEIRIGCKGVSSIACALTQGVPPAQLALRCHLTCCRRRN